MSAAHADMTRSALSEPFVFRPSFPFPLLGLPSLRLFELRTRRIAMDMARFGSLRGDLGFRWDVPVELVEATDATEGALDRGGVGDWAVADGGDWLDTDDRRGRAESTFTRVVRLPLLGRVERGGV